MSSEKTLAILFDKIAGYVESLYDRDPGHVLRASGPKTVDSTIASEISRGLGGAHLRSPTGANRTTQNITTGRDGWWQLIPSHKECT